jgi:hypothetical protein
MKITKEYIAGFVDGEGYFGLIRKSNKDCINGYYYTPVLKISQVTQNSLVLREIEKFIGYGNFWDGDRTPRNGRRVTSLEFRGMKRVIPIAKKLLPYLIVKREQAKLLIELESTHIPTTDANRDSIDKARTDIFNKLRILNKRGLAETKR